MSKNSSGPEVRRVAAHDHRTVYYHAHHTPLAGPTMQPEGYYESVNSMGEPVAMWDPVDGTPIFRVSSLRESCFSKSIGGALLGSVMTEDGARHGNVYVYVTEQPPDVDISDIDWNSADFDILEEVRYRQPVNIRYLGKFTISPKTAKCIAEKGYREDFLNKVVLQRLKRKLELAFYQRNPS